MHAIKLHAVIDATHRLQIDLPADTPEGEAEIIVLVRSARPDAARNGASLIEFFDALDRRRTEPPRTREEIEAQIAAERDSWD